MMNHCVPDFHEMEEDDFIPTHSNFSRPKRGEEEIMELLWQNGQVVMQGQNQRPPRKRAAAAGEVVLPSEREIRSTTEEQHHLFMQEDEMASWLQYPLDDSSFDRDFYADLLYSAPPPPPLLTTTTAQPRAAAEVRLPPPPRPPPTAAKLDTPRVHNFVHFSRLPIRPRTEAVPSGRAARESTTVVESNETPVIGPEYRVSLTVADSRPPVNEESTTAKDGGNAWATTAGEVVAGTCELTVTSSPSGSRTSFSGETHQPQQNPVAPIAADDRKRKRRETDDTECEDIDFEVVEAKKEAHGSASTKRSRAAEVHNLSERRRRDRINEKMRTLQELIPRCNKSDKASMLDEAIEYLKSLQLQLQMMSMGCGMVPIMYPACMQQYMPAMGMGMGMDMGMNRHMVPYPSMIPGPAVANPAAAAAATTHMAPRFPMPPFHISPIPVPDHSRMQATTQADPRLNPNLTHSQNHPRFPNFDPYQQYLGFHHSQLPLPQNQAVQQPNANKPSTSKDIGNPHNHQSG